MYSEVKLTIEDKEEVDDANKMPLFSSSLNVIDVDSPEDTQLAHNVLIIHRPKFNRTAIITASTFKPPIFIPKFKPTVLPFKDQDFTTQGFATPISNNHRPLNNKWRNKFQTTTTLPSILENLFTKRTTTTTTTIYEHEIPILINNNHRRPPYSYTTKQKLTSEYATYFTTPMESSSKSTTTTQIPIIYTESTTLKPQFITTTLSHISSSIVKRPPIKINHISGTNIKQPEQVQSSIINFFDHTLRPGFSSRYPPNTTIVHKNILVPIKPGRPTTPTTTTTVFPVYPVVAGITSWPVPTTIQWPRPTTASPITLPTFIVPQTDTNETISSAGSITDKPTIDCNNNTTDQMTSQSIAQPTTIVTVSDSLKPIISSSTLNPHRYPTQHSQNAHIVTVTPIKLSSSSTFLVTQSTQRPVVNAIWAPPPPVPIETSTFSSYPTTTRRPKPPQGSLVSSWLSPFTSIFDFGQSFSFLNILRSILYTFFGK